jgi:hypothetical protein
MVLYLVIDNHPNSIVTVGWETGTSNVTFGELKEGSASMFLLILLPCPFKIEVEVLTHQRVDRDRVGDSSNPSHFHWLHVENIDSFEFTE